MVTINKFRKIALSFPETEEAPHFENIAFKVNKKIFATLNKKQMRGCAKLSEIDQDVFSSFDKNQKTNDSKDYSKNVIYPVPNKWGKHGWTNVNLETVKEEMLIDFLTTAYCNIAPKQLASKYLDALEGI